MALGQIGAHMACHRAQPCFPRASLRDLCGSLSLKGREERVWKSREPLNGHPTCSFFPHPCGHTGSWSIPPVATFPPEVGSRPCHRTMSPVTPAIELVPQDPG